MYESNSGAFGLFVSINNVIYYTENNADHIHVRYENGGDAMPYIESPADTTRDVFVSVTGNIYANNENDHPVYQWTPNGGNRTGIAMNVTAFCFGLFIDFDENLLCSMADEHLVWSVSLAMNSITPHVVAGTGIAGSAPDMLWSPAGIFVRANFDLYVADSDNDRVQMFAYGILNATTVAGNGSTGTISLNHPTDVALDGNNYLFILDSGNGRIVADGSSGFQCIAACSGISGSSSNQLNGPKSLAFDNQGSIYVTDAGNNRIVKFLVGDCSGKCHSLGETADYAFSRFFGFPEPRSYPPSLARVFVDV